MFYLFIFLNPTANPCAVRQELMPQMFMKDKNGLENMNRYEKDKKGKPVVWKFGGPGQGGRKIGGSSQTAVNNFDGCAESVYKCFTDSQEGGDQLFEALSRCGIECVKAK